MSTSRLVVETWLGQCPQPRQILLGMPLTEARPAGEDRGFGLFAARAIVADSLVLSETSLILMKPTDDLPQLWSQYLKLLPEQRMLYDNLAFSEVPQRDTLLARKLRERGIGIDGNGDEMVKKMVQAASVMQTNAFNVDMADGLGPRHRALFPTVARINHSCVPNAHVCFYDPKTTDCEDGKGRMVIHALRDIAVGEEIVISYFSILLPRSSRQERAQKWSFLCQCPACSELTDNAEDEERRASVLKFLSTYKLAMTSQPPQVKKLVAKIEEGRRFTQECLESSYLRPSLPDIWDAIAMLYAALKLMEPHTAHHKDMILTLEESALAEARITGPQSPATRRRLDKLSDFARKKGVKPSILADVDGKIALWWVT